jgi:large subunit ribosomal protein L32
MGGAPEGSLGRLADVGAGTAFRNSLPNPPACVERRLDWRPLMAVPKRKTSKARRDQRRATHKLEAPRVNTCPQCGSPKRAHRICPTCGTYKGREVEPLRFDAS